MKSELSSGPSRATTLNQALVGRQPNTYRLFNNGSIFLLMGIKFAGTSPGNSAENYSAVDTDGYNDGPLRMQRTVVCIRRPGTLFCYDEIRAHTTEPRTGRHNCDGPSSGNRRVINDVYPIEPGWTFYQNQNV